MFWGRLLKKAATSHHWIWPAVRWEHPDLSLLQAALGPFVHLGHIGRRYLSAPVDITNVFYGSKPFYSELSIATHHPVQSLGSMNQGWPRTTVFQVPCRGGPHLDSKPWAMFHQHIFSRTNVGAKICFHKVYLQWRPVKNLRCQKDILCSARLCLKNHSLKKVLHIVDVTFPL